MNRGEVEASGGRGSRALAGGVEARAGVAPNGGRPAGANRWWVLLLLLACGALYLYRVGTWALADQDETKYAQIAVEMVKTGDPITLRVNGQPWYVHPPLYMWLVAATGRVLGFNEWTVRIWSPVFSVLVVLATVRVGMLLFAPQVGLLAGAILGVTLQYFIQSRLAVFDTALLLWMLLAFHAFCRAHASGRRADYLKFFLFAGLATLTKGPIGLLLPGLVIAAFVTIRGTWTRWREVPWGPGLAVYAIVGFSWYAVETVLHGRAFISSVVGQYTLGRFFGVVENQTGPWYFYAPVALLAGFPWTPFWPAAAAFHLRRWTTDGSLWVVLWCGITFVFYSIARTKLPNYILPVYPFAAIGVAALAAPGLDESWARKAIRLSLVGLAVLLAALFAGLVDYLGVQEGGLYHTVRHALIVPAAIVAAGLGVAFVHARRGRTPAMFLALCVAMAAAWIAVINGIMPFVEAQRPMKPLALSLRAALAPGDRIVGYRISIFASLIYYTDHHVDWVEDPGALRADLCAPGRVFVVLSSEDVAELKRTLPVRLSTFAQRSGMVVLRKQPADECASAWGTERNGHRHARGRGAAGAPS